MRLKDLSGKGSPPPWWERAWVGEQGMSEVGRQPWRELQKNILYYSQTMTYYATIKNLKCADKHNMVESQKTFCLSKEVKHRSGHTIKFLFYCFWSFRIGKIKLSWFISEYCLFLLEWIDWQWRRRKFSRDRHSPYFEGGGSYVSVNICKLHLNVHFKTMHSTVCKLYLHKFDF